MEPDMTAIDRPTVPLLLVDTFVKALAARIVSIDRRADVAAVCRSLYSNTKNVTECALDPSGFVRRAITSPAATNVSAWAGELAQATTVVDILAALSPSSTY